MSCTAGLWLTEDHRFFLVGDEAYPASNDAAFFGAWSVYPYLPSGTIIVSDVNNGLFVLSIP